MFFLKPLLFFRSYYVLKRLIFLNSRKLQSLYQYQMSEKCIRKLSECYDFRKICLFLAVIRIIDKTKQNIRGTTISRLAGYWLSI